MGSPLAHEAELVPAWPGRPIEVADTRVYVRHAPATSPLAECGLFLHGLGGGSSNWTDLMDMLRDRLECYAPDLPGFGQSPPPPDGAYDVQAQARTAVELIEAGGYAPVHLFGNSLGGTVATNVAAQRPDLVRTLTLISPALPDLRPSLTSALMLAPLAPGIGRALMKRAAGMTVDELARQNLEAIYGDPARIHPQRLRETADEIRAMVDLPHVQGAYVGALRGLVGAYLQRGRSSMWRQATWVEAPTLLVYGAADRFVSPRMAFRALHAFSRCRVVMLSGVGHVAQMETPEIVAETARPLLSDPVAF